MSDVATKSIRLFNTFTPVYYWTRDATSKIVINQGGTSSSKTVSILQHLATTAVKERCLITVVAETFNSLSRGALRDFKNLIDASSTLGKFMVDSTLVRGPYKFKNGSEIEFVSLDAPGKAKHGKREYLFVNEANHLDYEVVKQLVMRTKRQVYIDFNADNAFWVHTEYVPRKDAVYFISNYEDNPYCPQVTIDEVLEYKRKWDETGLEYWENKWKVYGLGETGVAEGAIYKHIKWIDEYPTVDMRYSSYALDFGFSVDPTAFIKVGVFDREIFSKGLFYETDLTTPEVIEYFKALGVKRYELIIADSSNLDAIKQIRRSGFNIVPITKYPNSVVSGIKTLQGLPINLVHNKHWRIEQERYQWKKMNGELTEIPVDKFNHYWDALRYWYQYHWPGSSVDRKPKGKPREFRVINTKI